MTRASRLLAQLNEWARATTRIQSDETGETAIIHHDPLPSRIAGLEQQMKSDSLDDETEGKHLRVLVDPNGSHHMWDGHKAYHNEVAAQLYGEPDHYDKDAGAVYKDGPHLENHAVYLTDKGEMIAQQKFKDRFPKIYGNIRTALAKKYPKETLLKHRPNFE